MFSFPATPWHPLLRLYHNYHTYTIRTVTCPEVKRVLKSSSRESQ